MATKKKVAAIVTEYRRWSHADVIVGKVLEGYLHDGKAGPDLEVVSMYLDQFPKADWSRGLAKKHGFTICDTIDGALKRGGKAARRRGVIIIGEHGKYPTNAKGQILYRENDFSRKPQRSSQQPGSRFPSSATSTLPRRGAMGSGCTTRAGSCSCPSWPARRCRSAGGGRP